MASSFMPQTSQINAKAHVHPHVRLDLHDAFTFAAALCWLDSALQGGEVIRLFYADALHVLC